MGRITGISPFIIAAALSSSCGEDGADNLGGGSDAGPSPDTATSVDAGSVEDTDLGVAGPPPRSLTARLSNVMRVGDTSEIPEAYRNQSPFEGLEFRVDALDPLQTGGLRFVVLPPFATEGGLLEAPSPGPNGGRIELSTSGCMMRCQTVSYDNSAGDARLVFGSFTFEQATDPEGEGWSPGTTGTLFGEEIYNGEGITIQADVTLVPDETAPTAMFVRPERGFILPWEGVPMRYSEPVDGRGLASFSLMAANAPELRALGVRLDSPPIDNNVIGADVRIVGSIWPEGGFTVRYAGGDLDSAGNIAGPAEGQFMDVAAPSPRAGIDFEDAATDPPSWGPEETVPGSVCNGGSRCKAIELLRPSTVGLYFRLSSMFAFSSVNLSFRHLAEVCSGPGAWARLSATVHTIGRAPGSPETLDTVVGEPSNDAPLGFSCDSGWVTRNLNVGSATDIGILIEISRSGNSSQGRRIILIDDIVIGS